jgi:hypothetical protein
MSDKNKPIAIIGSNFAALISSSSFLWGIQPTITQI